MIVHLRWGNAELAVLAPVDPPSFSFFCKEPCRQSSPPWLHHYQSPDIGWLLPVHYAEFETQMAIIFCQNRTGENWQ